MINQSFVLSSLIYSQIWLIPLVHKIGKKTPGPSKGALPSFDPLIWPKAASPMFTLFFHPFKQILQILINRAKFFGQGEPTPMLVHLPLFLFFSFMRPRSDHIYY
jgi:hypothetical protein